MFTVRGGLAHQQSCERAVRDHRSEIVPATTPRKVASAERTPASSTGGSPFANQIERESEIASADGVSPSDGGRREADRSRGPSSNLAN